MILLIRIILKIGIKFLEARKLRAEFSHGDRFSEYDISVASFEKLKTPVNGVE